VELCRFSTCASSSALLPVVWRPITSERVAQPVRSDPFYGPSSPTAMRIRELVTVAGVPGQNAYVARLIGSVRREPFDQVIVPSVARIRPRVRGLRR
jgi:hypothetical protein